MHVRHESDDGLPKGLIRSANLIDYSDYISNETALDLVWSRWILDPQGRLCAAPLRNRYRIEIRAPDGNPDIQDWFLVVIEAGEGYLNSMGISSGEDDGAKGIPPAEAICYRIDSYCPLTDRGGIEA